MVEIESRETGSGIDGISEQIGGIEAKRAKLRFKRAAAADTTEAFGNTSTTAGPRKQRTIPTEKRTAVSVSDSESVSPRKVRGRPPNPPEENEPEKRGVRKRTSTGKYKIYPTVENANAQANFLLSAIEMAGTTVSGPKAEMTDFERATLSGPLQRMIQRTPLHIIEKGGIVFDLGFLTIGSALYFSRVFKDVEIPALRNRKKKGVQEDNQAPVAAPAYRTVPTTKSGDIDGLAQPVPAQIASYMNGVI